MNYSSLTVNRRPGKHPHQGYLHIGPFSFNCLLGRSGITTNKKEGDGATPSGEFRVLYGYYRKDRIKIPPCTLELFPSKNNQGWCDAPSHPAYNSLVELPFAASHETLQRKDRLYDICLVLDYNIEPQSRYRGSAIFFHLTSPNHKPTEGCVALDPADMLCLLKIIGPNATMTILP